VSRPVYTVELGFGVGSLVMVIGLGVIGTALIGGTDAAGISWTPLVGVQTFECVRGRQDDLARVEAGTCVVIADNNDGRYAPENAASPYWPNVRPSKRLRITVTHNAITYPLFYGQVVRWAPVPSYGDALVEIQAVDLFRRLDRVPMPASVVQQDTGARIGVALDQVQWPATLRDLDVGKSIAPARSLTDTSALQHAQDVATVENGQFWIAGDGKATFRNRHARLTRTESVTSQGTFGGAGGVPLAALGVYDYSDEQVVNRAEVTRTGGVLQVASDSASEAEHGRRRYSLSSDDLLDDPQALALATLVVATRKDPLPRLLSLRLQNGGGAAGDDALWVQMFARELGHRLTVVRDFPGSFALNRDFWIERIRHRVMDGLTAQETEWQLSAALPNTAFVIGSATQGKIGTGQLYAY
jgi:hypothetical protein